MLLIELYSFSVYRWPKAGNLSNKSSLLPKKPNRKLDTLESNEHQVVSEKKNDC